MTRRDTSSTLDTAMAPAMQHALARIDRSGGTTRSRILPEAATTSPTMCACAVFGAYGVITLVVAAYERGRTG